MNLFKKKSVIKYSLNSNAVLEEIIENQRQTIDELIKANEKFRKENTRLREELALYDLICYKN